MDFAKFIFVMLLSQSPAFIETAMTFSKTYHIQKPGTLRDFQNFGETGFCNIVSQPQ
jgi:hypothetical protein